MARKIKNPLTTGLPAQIYILCYVNNETGYSIGKKLYGKKGVIPPTSKIYSWAKILRKKGYLEKNSFNVNIRTLLSEIKTELQKETVSLNRREEKKLENLLRTAEFRRYVSSEYNRLKKIIREENNNHTERILQNFNALKLITEQIGKICTLCYDRKKFLKQPLEEDEEKLEKIYKNTAKNWKDLLEGIKEFNAVVYHLKDFSVELLLKLSCLWPVGRSIIYSRYVEYYEKHEKRGRK